MTNPGELKSQRDDSKHHRKDGADLDKGRDNRETVEIKHRENMGGETEATADTRT